jgi:hypothetical protein
MESGKDLYKVVDNLQEKLINIGRSPGLAGEVLNAIFHPKSEWNEADPNQPRYWGNRSNFYRDPKDYILAFDIEGKNPWYLLTASQNDYVH